MQDNEILILEELEKNSNITQRGLSEKTGLSLGMVNILLKKFIKKGFVKIERLNSKSFRYILTPEGFKEKSKKTIEYMKIYYRRTLLIKQNIERIIQTYGRNRTYVLFGKDKEMKEIIEGILKELRVNYITENDVEKIESTNVVLYWNVEDKAKLEGLKCEFLMEYYSNYFQEKH
ncbi:winged helix-turn-helix transcriptional regulator [Petrotoga sp. Shatin.DS.tank11.9.2.9.3]|uniref:winged helix-turn-helix transcriptional regulator n=1 Tax=Petrotoga sp. Shatin.DS.tank11.9.2.9.3 TaxID=1469556 RepID=UPI000EF25448|nr:winged helix-turn-helix transcriptional regulator [Petrotoga sp. Shatin.DS.tank11.9.2.9.3]RLL85231.1 MarR family transcriptional regulator [Petrotoga sp. Shatin.DS.tank11.9.2.9.3]